MSWNPLALIFGSNSTKKEDNGDVLNYLTHFKEIAASQIDHLAHTSDYESTLALLNTFTDLKPSDVNFLYSDGEQGLIVKDKKVGWHRVWRQNEDDTFYSGWFYVHYNLEGEAFGPWYHYPSESTDVIKFFPSKNTWLSFHTDKENSETLYSIVITHTSWCSKNPESELNALDYVEFELDEDRNITCVTECHQGEQRMKSMYMSGVACNVTYSGTSREQSIDDIDVGDEVITLGEIMEELDICLENI